MFPTHRGLYVRPQPPHFGSNLGALLPLFDTISVGEWSPFRGISAYRFWDIAIENVVVQVFIFDGWKTTPFDHRP